MLDEMCASWGIVGNEIQALLHSHGHWSMNLINKHTFADSYFESFSLVLCFTLKVLQWRLSALLWLAVGVLLLFNFCLLFIYFFFFFFADCWERPIGRVHPLWSRVLQSVFERLSDIITHLSHLQEETYSPPVPPPVHLTSLWDHSWVLLPLDHRPWCWCYLLLNCIFFFFLFCVCASVWTLKCWVIAGKHGLMIHVCWFVC